MTLSMLALAIAPGLAIAIYVYWRDKYDREPLMLILKCFLLGIISVAPAVILQLLFKNYMGFGTGGMVKTAIMAFAVVGFTEEFSKFIFLRGFAYPRTAFNEPFDGITYSVMIAMGFATLENVIYVYYSNAAMDTALMRMFTAVPAHAACAVIMGFFVGLAKFRGSLSFLYSAAGLFLAAFSHGLYDFFLMQRLSTEIIAGAMISLGISIYLSMRAIKLHQQASPFRIIQETDPEAGSGISNDQKSEDIERSGT